MDKINTEKLWGLEIKTYCMAMHFSQLAGFLFPGLGLALPLSMWLVVRDKHVEVDLHGKNIVNWIISYLIYLVVGGVLLLVFAGAFNAISLTVVFVIFLKVIESIFVFIAAIKASKGQCWKYPLSIRFFK